MSLLPKPRSVEFLSQLNQYVNKHNGSVRGHLSYIAYEDTGAGEEYEDFGKYVKVPESQDPIQFHPSNPEYSEIFTPINVDEALLAVNGAVLVVSSRHNIKS